MRASFKLGEEAPHQGSPTREIHFDNCRIPADLLIGAEAPFKTAAHSQPTRVTIAARRPWASAQGALDFAKGYARKRQRFGRPIAEFQGCTDSCSPIWR